MGKAFWATGRRKRMQKMKTVGSKFLFLCPQVNRPEMFKYKQSHKATEVPYTMASLHAPGESLPQNLTGFCSHSYSDRTVQMKNAFPIHLCTCINPDLKTFYYS